jgi:AbrB family looped-hinge helix DNA binding protein
VDVQPGGDGFVDGAQELQVLRCPVQWCSSLIIVPPAMLNVANRLVVPWRAWAWVRRSGMPGIIGSTGWDRSRSEAAADIGRTIPIEWYSYGMRSTIDKAGRLVLPKQLRDSLGLVPGEVEVFADGAGLRIEPLASEHLATEDGMLVIPAAETVISDDLVRELRHADQR